MGVEFVEVALPEGIVIEVSRKITNALGWFLIFLGAVSIIALISEGSPSYILGTFFLPTFGFLCVLSARNVKKIVVGKDAMKFFPVGAELRYSEIERMIVPSWADRFDTPPSALSFLTFVTNTENVRYVPGAILQGKHSARINFHGSDGNEVLAALRERVPE